MSDSQIPAATDEKPSSIARRAEPSRLISSPNPSAVVAPPIKGTTVGWAIKPPPITNTIPSNIT
ncbi:MAG: hypothetical protein ACKVI3_00935, partial [Verrucomicrobiia bacterium]